MSFFFLEGEFMYLEGNSTCDNISSLRRSNHVLLDKEEQHCLYRIYVILLTKKTQSEFFKFNLTGRRASV